MVTEGGEKGWRHQPDTLARIKASKLGKGNHRPSDYKHSDDTKTKMSIFRYIDRGRKDASNKKWKTKP